MFEKWNFVDVSTADKTALKRNDLIDEAIRALADAYKDLAAAEALFRATMSERLEAHDEARFWVDVYITLSELRAER